MLVNVPLPLIHENEESQAPHRYVTICPIKTKVYRNKMLPFLPDQFMPRLD